MPGIAGIIGHGIPEERSSNLRRMIQCMEHEPFYTSGLYANEQIGLWTGWVSLRNSPSDVLPLWNEKKDLCLIFTGEDFRDAGEIHRLRSGGHEMDSGRADYLIHLYEEWGDRFFERLNGRFSGVLVDLRKQKAVLFNDRYGLSRIYYHERKDGFYFSSEAKSLLTILPEVRQINLTSLGETFTCGCVLQNRSLFAGISQLQGGSAWTFSPRQSPKKDLYFRPGDWESREPLGHIDYYYKLKETWKRILPRYMQSTERVAVSLTGGKDSRMIMSWLSSPPGEMPCYTFGGVYRECKDVKIARQVAKICRQPHQVIALDQTFFKEFPRLAERTVYLTDGAMDISAAPDLFVNRIARQIAPVRLTGNYGQEILNRAVAFKPITLDNALFDGDFSKLVNKAGGTFEEELTKNRLSFVAFKQVPWHHYSRLTLELSQITLRSPFLDNDLVALAYQVPEDLVESIQPQLRLIAEGNPALSRIGTDRSILYRPIPLVTKLKNLYQEFTFKAEYAYDYGMPHWLAKIDKRLSPLRLERLFLGRHKFYHFRIWYRRELSEYVKEILLDPGTRARPYLNGRRLEEIVKQHTQGEGNFTLEIHRTLTSELIQRQLIDERP